MTWDDLVEESLKYIDLSRFPLRMKLRVRPPDQWDGRMPHMLVINMYVADRENPDNEIVVQFSKPISPLVQTASNAVDFVYLTVKAAVMHELDECWLVGGERVRDPHRR